MWPRTGSATMGTDAQLAVLLRTAQWAMDDLAYDLGAERATPERMREMADALEKVTIILRQRADSSVPAPGDVL